MTRALLATSTTAGWAVLALCGALLLVLAGFVVRFAARSGKGREGADEGREGSEGRGRG